LRVDGDGDGDELGPPEGRARRVPVLPSTSARELTPTVLEAHHPLVQLCEKEARAVGRRERDVVGRATPRKVIPTSETRADRCNTRPECHGQAAKARIE
jgi:hypothetical protein